ncbi:MAG: DUF488 domain-containing protein [Planctomycetota bacterium]
MPLSIQLQRAYDTPTPNDGHRVLVDRVWPRGVKREALKLNEWAKELAPSTELRKWFGHTPDKFADFAVRYRKELACQTQACRQLLDRAGHGPLTLIYSARDTEHNQAVVLREHLRKLVGVD